MLDVLDPITAAAYKMMMMIRVAVEPRGSLEVVGAPRQTQLYQGLERAINGRTRDPGHALLYVLEKLIHGRMIVAVEERAQHHPALNRHGQLALA